MYFYDIIRQMYFKIDNIIHGDNDTVTDISSIYADLIDLFSYPNLSTKEAEIVGDLLTLTNQDSIHGLVSRLSDILDAYQDQNQDQEEDDPWGYDENTRQDGWGDNYEMA